MVAKNMASRKLRRQREQQLKKHYKCYVCIITEQVSTNDSVYHVRLASYVSVTIATMIGVCQ